MASQNLGYVQIENAVIDSPILTKEDKAFYTALKRFRNRISKQCFPSMERVTARAQVSKRTAYKSRKKLKSLYAIDWEPESGRKHSCHYRFLLEDGTGADIQRALASLKGKKIGNRSTNSNSEQKHCLNRENEHQKIEQHSTSNHMSLTKRNITNKGSDTESLPPSSLSLREEKDQPKPERAKRKVLRSECALSAIEEKEEKQRARLRRQAMLLKKGQEKLNRQSKKEN